MKNDCTIGILNTTDLKNRGSLARLIGLLNCIDSVSQSSCSVVVISRFRNKAIECDILDQMRNSKIELDFRDHEWFLQRRGNVETLVCAIPSLFAFVIRQMLSKNENKRFSIVFDIGIIEPDNLQGRFDSITSLGNFLGMIDLYVTRFRSKKKCLCSATIGPYNNYVTDAILKNSLVQGDIVTVRESSSIDYVKDNSLWNGYCQRTSDLAFGYYTSKDRENTNDINASNLHKKKKFIIVPSFMTPLGMKKSEMNLLNVNICRSVVNSTGLMPIVLSNTKQDDDPAITLYNSIRDLDGVEIILSNESIDNVANIIDNSQFMICNRFHAMVISSRIGVPFLGLVSYSPEKFKGILGEDLEMGDYLIDISNMRFDDIILNVQKKLSELTIGMNEVSIRLQKASNNAQHELVKNIGKILSICQMPENHG